jgi:hypothetical protein
MEYKMWECIKCGRKSGTKIASSYGCEHEWRDGKDLERAREQDRQVQQQRWREQEQERWRQEQIQQAEINRKIIAFNDELLNTEDGQKKLKGYDGWQWIQSDDTINVLWLDSNFGKSWLESENGQQYTTYLRQKNFIETMIFFAVAIAIIAFLIWYLSFKGWFVLAIIVTFLACFFKGPDSWPWYSKAFLAIIAASIVAVIGIAFFF